MAFFGAEALTSLMVGWLSDSFDHLQLFSTVIVVGDLAALMTVFVRSYWRVKSGVRETCNSWMILYHRQGHSQLGCLVVRQHCRVRRGAVISDHTPVPTMPILEAFPCVRAPLTSPSPFKIKLSQLESYPPNRSSTCICVTANMNNPFRVRLFS